MICKFIQLFIIGLTINCICISLLSAAETNKDENLLTDKNRILSTRGTIDHNRVLKRTTNFDTPLISVAISPSYRRTRRFYPLMG
uniref:Uncharacterized protein n=1 Tax=Glossina pallidipes TaxID=7398 RepID=A0A1B0AAQ9_GLOPL